MLDPTNIFCRKYYAGTDKCVYELPPFDPCFDPRKHNKYVKLKLQVERKRLIAERAKGQ